MKAFSTEKTLLCIWFVALCLSIFCVTPQQLIFEACLARDLIMTLHSVWYSLYFCKFFFLEIGNVCRSSLSDIFDLYINGVLYLLCVGIDRQTMLLTFVNYCDSLKIWIWSLQFSDLLSYFGVWDLHLLSLMLLSDRCLQDILLRCHQIVVSVIQKKTNLKGKQTKTLKLK